ncbi:MAG: uroporphyrinogen-III C-methyltransferase [Kiritimatiellia bacterium]
MTTAKITLKAGTRASRLARIQTRDALDKLAACLPDYAFEDVPLSSPGDRDQKTDLRQTPPDFFTQDLDKKVLAGELDCAVHSAKDLPDPVATGLDWFWLPWREDPCDVLIRPRGLSLASFPREGKIGVSSARREAYCRDHFPQARQLTIRGTIEDRLRQLDHGDFDLLVMAGAALNRLGLQDRITEWIPASDLPPPDGQGFLAITFRAGDARFLPLRRLFAKSVTFAAAGAGTAGACTLDCMHALQRCDICLHDTLLGHELFGMLPPTVQCIDVGKRCGQHSMPQDETTYLITCYARRGLKVVRLKGGDPGIFGRLAEEVEALDALALPYRVLPGVSSLSAATSTTGMLLTRRGVSRGFTVMTPRKEGGGTGSVAMDVRKQLPIVFFMALAVSDEIARQLIADGHAPETPAAVVFGAGSDQARVLKGTLANIATLIQEAACEMPGLLIVGQAAKYHYANWGALEGKRVLLTASQALQDKSADLVYDFGGVPVCRPLIQLQPSDEALACIRQISAYDWVVLTSPSAVRCFGDLLHRAWVDVRSVPALVTCGGGTSRELWPLGLSANIEPKSDFSADGLLKTVEPLVKTGLRILRLRSDKAGPGLAKALRDMGALVDDCVLYHNLPITHAEKPDFDVVCFASASAVEVYAQQWSAASLQGKFVVAIGKPTLAALQKIGVTADLIPPEATVESSIEALATHFVRNNIA